ncbi:VOC family protein [Enterocloster clostridioformis]|uniref:VOC family protein n=1 Tax=Enterocloster clostridioformis TaxID=1531 RepID=UPI00232F64E8|nr:VOC family protein [Enterocloster clostridioformis]MDB2142050.1 VOC family protein [Enterocloster clostridioformis]MDB2148972.1 VOC family protein [Enterocloster clostridioformis]
MKIHHVGYLTKNLNKSKFLFEKLGFIVEKEKAYDALRKIHIVFMLNGDYRIELIEPDGEESSVWGLLKRYKNTPYHFCYEVDDMNAAVKKMGWGGGQYNAFRTHACFLSGW